jgi:hypothetical protein
MQEKETAVEWLINQMEQMQYFIGNDLYNAHKKAKEMESKQMIDFHKWMLENDTPENAEKFFHFSEEDMLNYYKSNI